MSVTVHQILNDAKRLVSRLREHDSAADNIISQTQTLYKNVEAMKEYYEDVSDQQGHHHHPMSSRPLVVFNVQQQENRHILELQQENRELRDLLEEHQSVLQLVMSKYRQRLTRLLLLSEGKDQQRHTLDANHCSQDLQKMADDICKMAGVMKEAVELDDIFYATEQERLAELMTENRGLLELLDISKTYGSLSSPLNAPNTLEKGIQTDT